MNWYEIIMNIRNWLMGEHYHSDIFYGEKLVSDRPFQPKKIDAEDHPSWILPVEADGGKRSRELWMKEHYNNEVHPVDL